jgi:hypothetical protein
MGRKSIILTAVLAAGLALGIVAGPALRGSVASAQTQPPAQSAPTAQSGSALLSLFLDKLAARLNVQRSALDSAIVNAGNDTADAAVQQGTLTQAQADALKARIQADGLRGLLGGRGGPRGPGGEAKVAGLQQAMFDAAAKALNITTAELQTQLRSGQTLAQLAQAHNTTEQAVVNAALAAAKAQLDQAVSGSTLTQAQADAIYAQLQAKGANLLTPHGRGFGDRGGRGAPAAPQAPSTQPQT